MKLDDKTKSHITVKRGEDSFKPHTLGRNCDLISNEENYKLKNSYGIISIIIIKGNKLVMCAKHFVRDHPKLCVRNENSYNTSMVSRIEDKNVGLFRME